MNISSISFLKMIILCSPLCLSPPLQPSPMVPMLPIYSGDLLFLYFPCRLDPCTSLLGSSLLSRFSGVVNCRLVFLCFMSKSHLWVSTYDLYLSGSGLPRSIWCFLDPFICLKISIRPYFFLLCSTPVCKCTTFSLSILWSRGIEVVFRFWLWQTTLLWT